MSGSKTEKALWKMLKQKQHWKRCMSLLFTSSDQMCFHNAGVCVGCVCGWCDEVMLKLTNSLFSTSNQREMPGRLCTRVSVVLSTHKLCETPAGLFTVLVDDIQAVTQPRVHTSHYCKHPPLFTSLMSQLTNILSPFTTLQGCLCIV